MPPKMQLAFAKSVYPGYGFFGDKEITRLSIKVDNAIDSLDLCIRGKGKSYLNIKSINLFDKNGKKIPLSQSCEYAQISSTLASDAPSCAIDLLDSDKMFHSGAERIPRLSIVFKKSIEMSRIDILNRSGVDGDRSRNLVVDMWNGASEVIHYKNCEDSTLLKMLAALESRLTYESTSDSETENKVDIKAHSFRCTVADALVSGKLTCETQELMALLPMYNTDPIVNDTTLKILGVLVGTLVLKHKTFQTGHLSEFKSIMSTPQRILETEKYARKFINTQKEKSPELVIGKHNIGFIGLGEKLDEYKKVIRIVEEQLSNWGMESILCYGTLLGAVRDKGFIPHDDDVDMLYFDNSFSHDDMMKNRDAVLEKFRAANYKIWDSGTNFHVTPKGYTVGIDLFPCFEKGNQTSMMMEKYKYREISTSILKPVGKIGLYDEIYPAPNNPHALLEERYGKTWEVSNPFYEWPWALDDSSFWPARKKERGLDVSRTILVGWGQHIGPGADSPPKNSMSLIKRGIQLGFDAIEIDTRLSKDNIFVLGHDDLIIGDDSKKIKISEHSAKKLSKFSLGKYKSEKNSIISLKDALDLVNEKLVMLDPRVDFKNYRLLRKSVESAGFSPAKILFCGYGDAGVKELIEHFPESVILYKYYASHHAIDDFVLDELVAKNVDGLMLFWPMHYDDIRPFMNRLKIRNLQVLFYVHGSWPSRGETDDSEASLKNMIEAKADYITTTGANLKSFKRLIKKGY